MKLNRPARVLRETEIPIMRNTFFSAAMVAVMAIAGMPLGTSLASAQVELRIDRNGPQLRLRDDDCDPSYRECRERMRREDRWDERHSDHRRGCTAERALRKADRMGLRRARIVDVGRRTIEVAGRDRRGDRVRVRFGRGDRSCPIWG